MITWQGVRKVFGWHGSAPSFFFHLNNPAMDERSLSIQRYFESPKYCCPSFGDPHKIFAVSRHFDSSRLLTASLDFGTLICLSSDSSRGTLNQHSPCSPKIDEYSHLWDVFLTLKLGHDWQRESIKIIAQMISFFFA